jgi:carbonic anhydrase
VQCGSFPLESDEYKKYILPHKLTVVMNRRRCRDLSKEECNADRPPVADYPKYSGTGNGWSDLLNFDIKVPGEHRIYNETFDAEIQMLHAHLENKKLNSLGIPIRATEDGHNADFQRVLDQFHGVHYRDTQACFDQRRNLRQQDIAKYYEDLMEQGQRDGWYNEHTARIMLDPKSRRELQRSSDANFNPYSEDFMVDMFYFRYRGSMTEPPCMFLTWFFMDKPMLISFDQLRQVKFLLFTHVDPETCEKTSVHNADQSVARPLQPHRGDFDETSWIQHCIAGTFGSDLDRFGKPGRRCD